MKQAIFVIGFVILSGALLGGLGCKDNSAAPYATNPPPAPPPPNTFAMSSTSFNPTSMRVAKGTTVTWQNSDGYGLVHTSTSDTLGLWDTGNIAPGTSKTTTFNTIGTFTFHCTYHRAMGMVGTITVQ